MAWQTPKTNWATGDIPVADDFNRIEGNVQELQNTKETPAGAQAKANTAEANAKAYTDAHEQKAAPHSGHETPAGAQAKAEAAAGAVQADLDAHLADVVKHITATERGKWDKYFIAGSSGAVDWNTLTTPGANRLNMGSAPNGPGVAAYYHCMVVDYEYGDSLTQIAIPYGAGGALDAGMFMRTKYTNTWSPWVKFWHSGNDGAGSGLDAGLLEGKSAEDIFPTHTPGDVIVLEDTKYGSYSTGSTPQLLMAIKVDRGTAYRISFTMKTKASGTTAYGRIYRNGTPVGTQRSTKSTSDVTYTQDISGWQPGDDIQLYYWASNSTNAISVGKLQVKAAKAYITKLV